MKTQANKINGVNEKELSKYYIVKVANPGYDVKNPDKKRTDSSGKMTPGMLSVLALPYIKGSKLQIIRYAEAVSILDRDSIEGTQRCLHEISTLFEDLNTVKQYMEKCDNKNELHKLWLDVRNHIRHDIREELDNESEERKIKRAIDLKLNPAFQMDMGFAADSIKVGGINIKITTVLNYLDWAESIVTKILEEAKEKGHYRVEKG
jgi:hypothetical protein